MIIGWRGCLSVLALLVLTGCLTGAPTGAVTTDASQVRDQLFKLQKDSARILTKLDEMGSGGGGDETTQAFCAEALTRMDQLHQQVLILEEQLMAAQQRLDETLGQVRALRRTPPRSWVSEAGTPPLPGGSSPAGPGQPVAGGTETAATAPSTLEDAAPEDLFSAAYADYSRGHFDLALAGFEGALRADPNGHLADDAQYWIGETLFALKRYLDAVAAFDQLIANWPEGDKVTRAHLKRGIALFEARRTAEAVQTLEFVITTWPDSDEARIAQEYFRRKGIIQD